MCLCLLSGGLKVRTAMPGCSSFLLSPLSPCLTEPFPHVGYRSLESDKGVHVAELSGFTAAAATIQRESTGHSGCDWACADISFPVKQPGVVSLSSRVFRNEHN